jgi:DNA-binding transcriptional regulator LsrR (DeoR family)
MVVSDFLDFELTKEYEMARRFLLPVVADCLNKGPATASEIAAITGISHTTVLRVLRKMRARGMVKVEGQYKPVKGPLADILSLNT